MSVEQWSDSVMLAELSDDPQFSDDMSALIDAVTDNPRQHVLLNFSHVNYLNSSNIARLLKLRKLVAVTNQRKMKLCNVNTHVWGVFLVTGLDRLFDLADDLPSGLAALQIEPG